MSRLEGFYSLSDGWKSFRDGAVSGELALATVLLVTSDGGLSAGNTALRDILVDAGYPVTVRALSEPEDYTGIGVVVHSYGNPDEDNGKYVQPPVGMVGIDTWRPLGMGTLLGYQNTVTQVEVVDSSSPLAGGVTGVFDAYLAGAYITWETDLTSNPDVIVTRPAQTGQAVVFAYEAGDRMPGRFATTRHVALGYHQDGFAAGLTSDGEAQVLAAVKWALASSYVAPPAPLAPTGVSASAGDGSVRLSWDAQTDADTFTAKRSTTSGGAYTNVGTGLTSTSYTDTGLTNGTVYYYVVSATNTAGESPDSDEVTAIPTESSNVAMLATSAELAMWQDRSVNGPFKSTGDFSTNSPGHWDEMVACKSLDFTTARWSGPEYLDGNGAVEKRTSYPTNDPTTEARRSAHDMMSAAYAAMIDDETATLDRIVTELVWHAGQARLDFSNTTLYPRPNHFADINPLFMIGIWVIDLILAYDICKAQGVVSSADQAIIEGWFSDLAVLSEATVHYDLSGTEPGFANRKTDDYTSRGSNVDTLLRSSTRLANGNIVEHLNVSQHYNNRRDAMMGVTGLIGVLTSNQTFIDEFKRYMREWLMFGNRTTTNQATFPDHDRATYPQQALYYDSGGYGHFMPAVEALARSGDTSVYDFSSSEGSAHPTWGSNHFKTMEEVLDQRIRWVDMTIPAQYSGGNPPPLANAGDETYRIKTRTDNGNELVGDGYLLMAACYYNRPDWVDPIMRVGTPSGFTPTPRDHGKLVGWRVDWRTRFLRSFDANPHGGA